MKSPVCKTAGKVTLALSALLAGWSGGAAIGAEALVRLGPPQATSPHSMPAHSMSAQAIPQQAGGPNSSLLRRYSQSPPMTKVNFNWIIETPKEKKELRKNDLVTVIVQYSATMTSEGEMDRKKKANGELTLTDWVLLSGLHMFPDPQSRGDPRVAGKVDNKYRAESSIETRDRLQFTMACHVAEIRPNGNLILEGRRSFHINEEYWDLALTGEVRPDDVAVDNSILSEDIADLNVEKQDRGHVRDGYRRGWLLRLLDKYQPF